jgi:topoisomerase-4 subunit A
MTRLDAVMRRNFVDYASYAILDRAIPDLRDGLKPVQRRLLHTLFEMHDGRFHKVANVIGETMKLHPHGDASIGDALVVLANKDLFIERQGNFGSILTGHPAAAARYIECRLTPLALEALFNEALTEFVPSYDGRSREPVFLPAKLPVVLMLGADGIAVGMATRILPHNAVELWEAQIAHLSGKPFELHPDFPQGGHADVSEYDDGRGKVAVRAVLDGSDPRKVVIRAIPFGTTTESLVASIEAAIQRGRVQIAAIHDYTTDKVEIELELSRGVRANDVIPQLFAYTDCAVSVSSNLVVVRDRKPVEMTITEVLHELTDQLRDRLKAELQYEQEQLTARKHWITLERIFVEEKVYRGLETARTEEAVRERVWTGMQKFKRRFVREMTDDDVKRLLELRIRRISAFDLDQSKAEEAEIESKLRDVAKKLGNMKATSIAYVKDLIARHGKAYPRRTKLGAFREIDKKAVARPTLKVAYDATSGFLGTAIKGDALSLAVTEFDLILAISDDGSYRILPAPDKLLIPGKLLHCSVFDPDKGAAFTVIYRDRQRFAFGKRIAIQGFIRGKEYLLIKDKAGKVDLLLPGDAAGTLHLKFAAMKRQRVHEATFDLADLEQTGVGARGTRLAPKPVARITVVDAPPPKRGGGRRGEQAKLF